MSKEELKTCFDDWFDELRHYITYRCYDPELATDIVQEVFVRVWEKDIRYQGKQTRSLLYKMAGNLWVSQYRKQQNELKYRMAFHWQEGHNEIEEDLNYNELKDQYEKALREMNEKRRSVFLMSRMDQLSYREIANRLGISEKAVEKRMHLALRELRKKLNYGKQETRS